MKNLYPLFALILNSIVMGILLMACTNHEAHNDAVASGSLKEDTWLKIIRGSGDTRVIQRINTMDHGFIIAGFDIGLDGGIMIMKLDGEDNVEWRKIYHGSEGFDYPTDLQQTMDGGYIVIGALNYSYAVC